MALIERMIETPVKVRVCDHCSNGSLADNQVRQRILQVISCPTGGIRLDTVTVDSEGQVDLHDTCVISIAVSLREALYKISKTRLYN